jgi:hypothetical protein
MHPERRMRQLALLATAFLLLAARDLAAGEGPYATIIASSVPELPVGRAVSDAEQIYVPEKETVSLLFRDGRTLTVTGPRFGVIVPAAPPKASEASFLAPGHDAGVIGAARTVERARAPRIEDPRLRHAYDR